jgi:hypothetical protein
MPCMRRATAALAELRLRLVCAPRVFLLFVHPRVSDVRMSLSRRFRARGGAVPLVVWLDGNFYTKVP